MKKLKALKEWAIIVETLAKGQQILLIRKGGLLDSNEGFCEKEFFLFPTVLHQNSDDLMSAMRLNLERLSQRTTRSIPIEFYARMIENLRVKDFEKIKALEGLHVWSPQFLTERFNRGTEPYVDLLILRVYQLPQIVEIENRENYNGCTSWVELEDIIDISGSKPVLSDKDFEDHFKDIKESLK